MSGRRAPVAIWDEGTSREHRETQRVVKSLPPDLRHFVARHFIGWRVIVEMDWRDLAPADSTIEGYCEAVAHSHNGGADLLLLTLPGELHDLSRFHAYSLATVRSIKTITKEKTA